MCELCVGGGRNGKEREGREGGGKGERCSVVTG